MEYRFVGFLRIPNYLHCGVVYGHKPKNKPELMQDLKGRQVWVDSCVRCGAQKTVGVRHFDQLVQINP